MSLTDERSLRSVNQLPPLTIMPPAPGGLTVGVRDLMAASWLYGGIALAEAAKIIADAIARDLYIDQARAITSLIDQNRSIDSYIDKERSITLER